MRVPRGLEGIFLFTYFQRKESIMPTGSPGQPRPQQRLNLIGQQFGKLNVRRFAQMKNVRSQWMCRCECGTYVLVLGTYLYRGRTTSCGCASIGIPKAARAVGKTATMGHLRMVNGRRVRSPEYQTWLNMKARCYNSRSKYFEDYGGRCIIVCDRWLKSFLDFLSDMGLKPSAKHSIDRVNNNGNYEPANCKWSTQLEQIHNRRPRRKKSPVLTAPVAA